MKKEQNLLLPVTPKGKVRSVKFVKMGQNRSKWAKIGYMGQNRSKWVVIGTVGSNWVNITWFTLFDIFEI